jgi:large subunit ribosomal protein L35
MPKLKTHKGAQHRFHVTGSGKILRHKVGKSHLRRKKTKRVKREYRKLHLIHTSVKSQVKRLIPYTV